MRNRRGNEARNCADQAGPGRCRHAAAGGMTLVEVLLALAILSTGMIVLLAGVSRCLAVTKKAELYQRAQWAMDQGELDHPLIRTNDVESLKVSPARYGDFTYSREIEEPEDAEEDDPLRLYTVRTRVTWSDKGSEMGEEVVRFLLQRKQ